MANFVVRSFKSVAGRSEVSWANTYEFSLAGEMSYGAAQALATGVVEAEREIHLQFVSFDRVTVSTWGPDSTPYDPTALYTVSAGGLTGLRSVAFAASEVLDTVLWVRRIAVNGRNGRIFYRGVLTDLETEEDAQKKPALKPASVAGMAALVNSLGANLLAIGEGVSMVMIGKSLTSKTYQAAAVGQKQAVVKTYGPQHSRLVLALALAGVSRLPIDHGYFDIA